MYVFSERLKDTRISSSSTQKQVAIAIEIPESQYQKYEHGKIKPSFDGIIKLCNYFNVSANYLLGLSDEPTPLYDENGNKINK